MDREFQYSGDENAYCSAYVDALKKACIHVGVITNHNKFDLGEFIALKKTGEKKNIFLLPGVELSVSDGANGIHVLVVFADSWIESKNDRISLFLNNMFFGKTPTEYQNENGCSDKNLLQMVEELNRLGHDYFLIFAHVEKDKGLWKELGGGRFKDWCDGRYQTVKERTLGFQQVRTREMRQKVKQWIEGWYPAEVEGSDPKNIEQIGRGKGCYLKLGAFTFEAVKFALVDCETRVCLDSVPQYTHSRIKQICFEGGTLDGQTIRFSPELNTLIGIRGSGKSSILEALRYVLDIRLEESDSERGYKQRLVERTLGSGGKVVLDVIDRHGQPYQIRRILKENAQVFVDEKWQPGLSIHETVLNKPLFFGQKELAAAGRGSEKDLIEKLLGAKCDEIHRQIAEQKVKVANAIDRLLKISNLDESIAEQRKIKQDAEFRLNFYKKHQLEEKLQKRLAFEADIRRAETGIRLVERFTIDIKDLLAKHEDELRNFPGYLSANNAEFFKQFDDCFEQIVRGMESIKMELTKAEIVFEILKKAHQQLTEAKDGLTDEFAAVERALAAELKTASGQNISTDEFLASKKKLAAAEAALAVLLKSRDQKATLQNEVYEELQKLNDLWYEEFRIIRTELDEISNKNTALRFSVGFKEDKSAFLDYFKNVFRGSNVRESTFQNIVEKYSGFSDIYRDFENAKKLFGSNPDNFTDFFERNLKNLLTHQTPNQFTIAYHEKELAEHSLGQRASALILFVLGQQENDVIIIDQPEDDLDNRSIYEDVIKLIRALKPKLQFIFATHNPNIPVLGDAEQIHACSFSDGKISIRSGGLDDPIQQEKIVVIMEGGKEAFERRKEIYQIWKS
jgi:ABC-type cobalamin/Fe3+-siderophores transport system ATPase subunit